MSEDNYFTDLDFGIVRPVFWKQFLIYVAATLFFAPIMLFILGLWPFSKSTLLICFAPLVIFGVVDIIFSRCAQCGGKLKAFNRNVSDDDLAQLKRELKDTKTPRSFNLMLNAALRMKTSRKYLDGYQCQKCSKYTLTGVSKRG